MNSLTVVSALLLSLTVATRFSFGFLQQHSEKYYSVATKNAGDYITAKEGQIDQAEKSLTRNSRSIHVLFPPNGKFYVPPSRPHPPMQMISTTTTTTPRSTTTSKRPPKQYPGFNTNKDKHPHSPQLPGSKDCNPNCGCSTQYIPFCASNNVTYRNKCQLNCAQLKCDSGIRRKFEGVCPVPYVHHKPHRKFRYISYNNY